MAAALVVTAGLPSSPASTPLDYELLKGKITQDSLGAGLPEEHLGKALQPHYPRVIGVGQHLETWRSLNLVSKATCQPPKRPPYSSLFLFLCVLNHSDPYTIKGVVEARIIPGNLSSGQGIQRL